MRIQRPRRRSVLTALNDCDPHDTCMTASVRYLSGPLTRALAQLAIAYTTIHRECAGAASDHHAIHIDLRWLLTRRSMAVIRPLTAMDSCRAFEPNRSLRS